MDLIPKVATVLVPCTCGELVQGVLEGEPMLVSCPVDSYSRVDVRLGVEHSPGDDRQRTKALQAAEATLRLLGLGEMPLALEASCPLPPCKGFGTSTADVVGAIVATAAAAGAVLSPPEVARLAVSIEPSDGTMFPGLALFAHRTGRRWETLGPAPPLELVVLDFDGGVDTLEYNAALDLERLRTMGSDHERALDLLRRGLRERRPELISQAATTSARVNQCLLPKPGLEETIAMAHDHGALGVCAAHSGTALGVILAPGETAGARRLLAVVRSRLAGLRRAWIARMVDGGPRLVGVAESPWDELVRGGKR